jgi:hypothetical protein
MGSLRFDGVRFAMFVDDHPPPHAHGSYGSVSLVVEFGDPEDIGVRRGSTYPKNAKRSQVRKILDTALEHYDELRMTWEAIHGEIER